IWRPSSAGQAQLEADIATVRRLDFATSGMWIERPYARAVNTFDFEPERFPDPATMITRAHEAGVRLALWSTPYLEEAAQPMVTDARARGVFPLEVGGQRNPWSAPVDFTSPDASAFWRGLVRRYTSMGIDGFKLDYGEDIIPSIGPDRIRWAFSDGSDERT